MTEKIKVPNHVASALEPYSKMENKGDAFIDIKSLGNTTEKTAIILKHLKDNDLMSALINGYEIKIERTLEEELFDYYSLVSSDTFKADFEEGIEVGMKRTLDILGIKIEGITG